MTSGYRGMRTGFDQPVAPEPAWNLPAIFSLVTSLLCCWPAGAVLGVIGVAQTKGGKMKGRGLAIAGLAISSLGALVTLAAVLDDAMTSDRSITRENAQQVADDLEREVNADTE